MDMSVSNGMRPVHPGEILGEELEELGLSASALAKALDVPTNRVTAILKGQRGMTADTALRLSRYFGSCGRTSRRPSSCVAEPIGEANECSRERRRRPPAGESANRQEPY